MNINLIQDFWFFLIGGLLFVFSLLDGFDLGVGMLLPFYSRQPRAQVLAINSIWPVWDGNELWGLLAGGALLAIFPSVFTRILSGMYPFIIIFLVALMYRPISFEILYHRDKEKKNWEYILALTSFLISFLFGTVIGNTIVGFTVNTKGLVNGGLFSLLNPFSLLTGLVFTLLFAYHGAIWLGMKLEGTMQDDALGAAGKLMIPLFVLELLWFLWSWLRFSPGKPAFFWISGGLMLLLSVFVIWQFMSRKAEGNIKLLFILSGLGTLLWWILIATIQFPVLIRSRISTDLNLTVHSASAPDSTLTFLAIATPLILLGVMAYTIFVYRIFKGKVPDASPEEGGIGY